MLPNNISVVDDSYNASPLAVRRLLELLARVPGRRVAVLGEMYELGEMAAEAHRRVGREAAASCDLLIAVGGDDASRLADAARAAGLDDASVQRAEDAAGAADLLRAAPAVGGRGACQGFARRRSRSHRCGPGGGGGGLMLYWLILPLSDTFIGFNVFRYLTFRAGPRHRHGFLHQPGGRPLDHWPAAGVAGSTNHPRRGAGTPPGQSRDARPWEVS